jgi:hypothetical protein
MRMRRKRPQPWRGRRRGRRGRRRRGKKRCPCTALVSRSEFLCVCASERGSRKYAHALVSSAM